MGDRISYALWSLQVHAHSFGLVNASAAFQGHINNELRKHLDQFCIAYLDNIIVYSNSLEEQKEHVWLILVKLQKANIYLTLSEWKFKIQQISFVRYIVTLEDVEMEPDRVCTIEEWPEPTCYHNIQVFLSFANFYRRFISSFSRGAKPRTDHLKGGKNGHFSGPFPPIPAMKRSFAELRDAFTKAPVLAHFDMAKLICLETDASGYAIAGIILQQQDEVFGGAEGTVCNTKGNKSAGKGYRHHIAFWSRSMSPAEQNYAIGDQKLLAIVRSCCYWHHYLKGERHPVVDLTDYHNL